MDSLALMEAMRNTPALRGVPLPQLGRLADTAQVGEFASGDLLMAEGAAADAIYVLLEGEVRVTMRRGPAEIEIALRTAPDLIGEAALFDAGERIASVAASSDVRAAAVSPSAFLEAVTGDSEALVALLRGAFARLRQSDTQLIESLGRELRALSSANERLSTENRQLRSAFSEQHVFENYVGESRSAREVRAAALRAAQTDLPVLLIGETGTGKEVLARAIHAQSARAERPFVALNCAHLTESLLESELFGHARGAFTGASQTKRGLVEEADGGTLFLDEAADMPLSLQGALLRFLELGEFRRLGETQVRRARVGLIAATQRDLDGLARAGEFRLDLLYRLDVMRLSLPPLRSRMEDLPLLAEHCSERIARRLDVKPLRFSSDALRALASHDFPGNVRELENEIERLYLSLRPGALVRPESWSQRIHGARIAAGGPLHEAVRAFKIFMIEKALLDNDGVVTRAAAQLGVERSNLSRSMKALGIQPGDETPRLEA